MPDSDLSTLVENGSDHDQAVVTTNFEAELLYCTYSAVDSHESCARIGNCESCWKSAGSPLSSQSCLVNPRSQTENPDQLDLTSLRTYYAQQHLGSHSRVRKGRSLHDEEYAFG